MAVTHTPVGYAGTVDEVGFSKLLASLTPRFRVASSSDWALSVSGTTNRTINIAAGSATACGVQDTTTAQDAVSFAANSGGTNRYDALVARFVWGSDTVTFAAIQGTTSPPAVNTTTTVDNAKINRIPGVQYDALLAVVQIRPSVGNFASGDLFDMRPYGGLSGPVMLPNSTYLSLVDARAGAEVYAVDTGQRWLTTDGSTWSWPPEAQGEIARVDYTTSGSGQPLGNSLNELTSYRLTTSYIPANRRIRVSLTGTIDSDTTNIDYTFYLYQGAFPGNTTSALRGYSVNVPQNTQGFTAEVTINTTTALSNQLWTVGGVLASGGTPVVSVFGGSGWGPSQFIVEDVGAV